MDIYTGQVNCEPPWLVDHLRGWNAAWFDQPGTHVWGGGEVQVTTVETRSQLDADRLAATNSRE